MTFFSYFSGLKPNLTKSEIAGIGILKGVQLAACSILYINLNNDTLKILLTYFCYNEKLKEENIFHKTVTNIQCVLKIWKMRNLTLEGKIIIFKTISISNIVFQSFIITAPKHSINELEKIQKAFLWKNATPKIKHEILCNDHKVGGLKNVDIPNKILGPNHNFCIRRLEWKLIPVEEYFGSLFKFH